MKSLAVTLLLCGCGSSNVRVSLETPGDLAAFRQEITDRFGPMPEPVVRLVEVAELRLAAEEAGVASISREDGLLVVRFGQGLTRATAMRLLGPGSLPSLRPGDVTFASNQVRLRLPRDPGTGWRLTQAVVGRLSVANEATSEGTGETPVEARVGIPE